MAEDETKSEQIGIRITPSLRAALEELAKQDKRKLAPYCEIVLAEHVEQRLKQRGRKK